MPAVRGLSATRGPNGPLLRGQARTSRVAWVLTVWLLYGLARRLFDLRTAVLAAALFAVNATVLRYSSSGLAHSLTGALLLALLWVGWATVRKESDSRPPPKRVVRRAFWSAVLTGLVVLSDFGLWVPVVGVMAFRWLDLIRFAHGLPPEAAGDPPPESRLRRGWRAVVDWWRARRTCRVVLAVATGLLLTLGSFMIRQHRLTGHYWLGLGHYDLLTQTQSYPGLSVYRRFTTDLPAPWKFGLHRPRQMRAKAVEGLVGLPQNLASQNGVMVLALFLVGCLLPVSRRDRGRVFRRDVLAMLGLYAGVLCFTSRRLDRLLIFVPVITMLGSTAVFRLYEMAVAWRAESSSRGAGASLIRQRRLATAAVWVLAALPVVSLWPSRPSKALLPSPNVEYLAQAAQPEQAILTDAPWLVAWYADRPAVWLVQEEEDLPRLESKVGQPLAYLYFSRYRPLMSTAEVADWWLKALQSPLGYKTFLPHPSPARGEVILKRYAAEKGARSPKE